MEHAARVPSARQRRRQHYHHKKVAKTSKLANGKKRGSRKKTIDNGVFSHPLKEPRRVISIKDKLEVLKVYKGFMQQKKKAQTLLQEPKPLGGTQNEIQDWKAKRKAALKDFKLSALKKTREMFPQFLRGGQVCKWQKAAHREKWADLPEIIQSRCSATQNEWREKVGISLKGKRTGGLVPMVLQIELDHLMTEMASGVSTVSERKELVTTEHVVAR